MNKYALIWRILFPLSCLTAVACAPQLPVVRGAIYTAENINPDYSGRPSPLVVRIYQLKTANEFSKTDYFSLFEKEQETIGEDLLQREEIELQPEKSMLYSRKLNPDTRFIGIAAAFRDIEQAKWRTVVVMPQKFHHLYRNHVLKINLSKLSVSASYEKNK